MPISWIIKYVYPKRLLWFETISPSLVWAVGWVSIYIIKALLYPYGSQYIC